MKVTGILLTVLGGLFLLSGVNLSLTKYNLRDAHDLNMAVGGFGFAVILLGIGVGLIVKANKAERSAPQSGAPPLDAHYFSRALPYTQTNQQIVVQIPALHGPPHPVPLDPWPQAIFLAADGVRPVGQFVHQTAAASPGGLTPVLHQQLHDMLHALASQGILHIHPYPQPLPPHLAQEQPPLPTIA